MSNLVKTKPKTYLNTFKKQLTTLRSDKEFERNETYKTQLKNYSNWLSEYQGKNYNKVILIVYINVNLECSFNNNYFYNHYYNYHHY